MFVLRMPMQIVTIDNDSNNILQQVAVPLIFPLTEQQRDSILAMKTFFLEEMQPSVGLAATQVGLVERFICVWISEAALAIRPHIKETFPLTTFINPTYEPITDNGKDKDWEGCLSVPKMMGEVWRYKSIRYRAYNLDGEILEGVAHDLLARIIQHETDHLDGILYTERLTTDCRFGEFEEMMAVRRVEAEAYLKEHE